MKICPKCNTDHDKPGMFCSRHCANSRVITKESNLKRSISNKKYWDNNPEKKKKTKGLIKYLKWKKENKEKIFLEKDFDLYAYGGKRTYVIYEQKYKCNKCGISEWLGKKITLEIDHIDGNKKNNDRKNLEGLCPNCHSLTPTWRGRNNTGLKNSKHRAIKP